jgi:toxin CcdB
MAQFDVHRIGDGLAVDCQSDLLAQLDTRFVAPLVSRADVPQPAQRLNPMFNIDGQDYVMLAQAASAVRKQELGPVVTSLAGNAFDVTGAIDVLISGV